MYDDETLKKQAEQLAKELDLITGPTDEDLEGFARISPSLPRSPRTKNHNWSSDSITIRIPHYVLHDIRQNAAERGIPYQTLINQILRQHAED